MVVTLAGAKKGQRSVGSKDKVETKRTDTTDCSIFLANALGNQSTGALIRASTLPLYVLSETFSKTLSKMCRRALDASKLAL